MVRRLIQLVVAAALVAGVAPAAEAQSAPDIRNVRPLVMLLVDTSGSMERLPDCVCSTPSCTECLPMCTATPDASDHNRWATVLEALTGEFQDVTCAQQDRSGSAYLGQYDYGYAIPHHDYGFSAQLSDGILDAYLDRVKFGLMTFDGIGTFTDTDALVLESAYLSRTTDAITAKGDYSYGEPKPFWLPGCTTNYMMDNGARNESAAVGRMVSVGSDLLDDSAARNADIQNVLLSTRPFGTTPIAGMLDDVRYYFNNHPDVAPASSTDGDEFFQCRNRFVLLITDGAPSGDMRRSPFNCDATGSTCPYDRTEEIAADLCALDPSSDACEGLVNGVFVVGFDIADAATVAQLNDIAALGGTGEALFAEDRTTLLDRIGAALDTAAPGTTTRTVPAFTQPTSSAAVTGQFQFNTGFNVGSTDGTEPWSGVLERRRFLCDGTTVEEKPIEAEDRFHEILNDRATPRNILTVVPRHDRDTAGHLVGEDTGVDPLPTGATDVPTGRGRGGGAGGAPAACYDGGGGGGPPGTYSGIAEEGLAIEPFTVGNANISRRHLGVGTTAERQEVIEWVHGVGRENAKLGDIYHSSPAVVGPPALDLPDESYNEFRSLPVVANRPTVLYVATNDGLLHAFATEKITINEGPHAGTTVEAGEELWAFVPPFVYKRLQSAMASHQFLFDGTPVAKDVFLKRLPGAAPDAGIWRTMLLVPFGRGGGGYLAMDVTDPLEPKFMWQFAAPDMGVTIGTPALGQVLVEAGGALQERAIAVLPAGGGDDLTDYDSGSCGAPVVEDDGHLSKPLGCPARGKGRPPVTEGTLTARDNMRCWTERGRKMYFLDPATGEVVKVLDDTTFNAPLTGGVSLFSGEVATIATRAFFADHDGVLWRLDFGSPAIRDWDADPIHDMFWDGAATDGQPAYYPPVLSTDTEGRVVIIQATGNIDRLDGLSENRVVSLTEEITFDATGAADDVSSILNWEVRLEPGEQVTGPLELFNGNLYFGSFKSSSSATDACAYGFSRLWGVHYREAETGTTDPAPAFDEDDDGVEETSFLGPFDNQVIMGVAITKRPSCFEGSVITDPFFGRRFAVTDSAPGEFQLVAQVSGGGTRLGGGEVSEIRRTLEQPPSVTVPTAWAGIVE